MNDPFAPRIVDEPRAPEPWVAVLAALDQLRAAISDTPTQPAPVVHVEPPDLSEIVTAVQGLKGPATADEIARALRDVLAPAAPGDGATAEVLTELAASLKKLDWRMQADTRSGFAGGGVVTLDPKSFSTAAPLPVSASFLSNQAGTWDYRAGTSGSPRAFTGRVLGITAHCTTAGSMTINGGDSVPIPANVAYVWTPLGNLVSPTLVFTGTDSFGVEFVA